MSAAKARAWVGYVGSLVLMVLAEITHKYVNDWRTWYLFWGGAVGACLSFIYILIEHFFDAEYQAERTKEFRRIALDLEWVKDRMAAELHNFDHINLGKPYSGEAHRRAVEDSSFELLEEELEKLRTVSGYTKIIPRILNEITKIKAMPPNRKDVTQFLPMFHALEKQIAKSQRRYPPPLETQL